jgi:hypothetical protein
MADDIVTRLREVQYDDAFAAVRIEIACREIERLREELRSRIHMCDARGETIRVLVQERDEARREICMAYAPTLPQPLMDYARERGWDCFDGHLEDSE